jgi:hypothetical protein
MEQAFAEDKALGIKRENYIPNSLHPILNTPDI